MNENSADSTDRKPAPTDPALALASSLDGDRWGTRTSAAVVLTPWLAMEAQAEAAHACLDQFTGLLDAVLRISTALMVAGQDPGRSAMTPLIVAAAAADGGRLALRRDANSLADLPTGVQLRCPTSARILLDSNLLVRRASRSVGDALGISPRKLAGTRLEDWLALEPALMARLSRRAADGSRPWREVIRLRMSDLTELALVLVLRPLHGHRGRHLLVSLTAVRDRRAAADGP